MRILIFLFLIVGVLILVGFLKVLFAFIVGTKKRVSEVEAKISYKKVTTELSANLSNRFSIYQVSEGKNTVSASSLSYFCLQLNNAFLFTLFSAILLMLYAFLIFRFGFISLIPVYLCFLIYLVLVFSSDWPNLLKLFIASLFLIPADLYRLPINLPFNLEIYRAVAFIIFGMWLIALLTDDKVKLRRTSFDLYLFLFSFSVTLSLIFNLYNFEPGQEFAQAIKAFIYFLSFIILYYLITTTIRTRKEVESTLKFMVWLGTFVAFLGIIERLTGFNVFRHLHIIAPFLQVDPVSLNTQLFRSGLRVTGSVVHPIAFGTLLAMVLPFSIFFSFNKSQSIGEKKAYYISSFIIFISALLTVSRTALIGLLTVLFTFFWFYPQKRKAILALTFVLFFIVHMLFPGTLGTLRWFLTPKNILKMEVNNPHGRLQDYPKVWEEFLKAPLLGRGFETFDAKRFFYVDNQYLKFLTEIGLLGVLSFVIFLISAMLKLIRFSKTEAKDIFLSIVACCFVFILASFTFDTFGFSQIPYIFFLVLALGSSLRDEMEKKKKF